MRYAVHDLMNVALLISAILTCLAIGVGVAYGLCNLMFAMLRPPAMVTVSEVADIARV